MRREDVVDRLRSAGFLAPDGDADALVDSALCDEELEALVRRRIDGEPLAWLVGRTTFAGVDVAVHPGVYVPRPQSAAVVEHARAHLRPGAVVVDACCGSGALGRALGHAGVIGIDVDPRAVANAAANGLDARHGDLLGPVSQRIDLVVAVVPYVPTDRLPLLPRDVRRHEPLVALDGGADGLAVLRRLAAQAAAKLVPRGVLVAEVGIDEHAAAGALLRAGGFDICASIADADGDVRAVCARRRPVAGERA